MQNRIGQGIDVHKLVAGRKLMLGGIEIPFEKGLEGHSDADALLHAVIDAILGALSLGDIGRHFPNTDPKWKNVDSKIMLTEVVGKMKSMGFKVSNIDSTVVTEEPKLKPHIEEMRKSIAKLLEIEISECSVKAGTNEKLGFLGRGEGILAQSIVLLTKG